MLKKKDIEVFIAQKVNLPKAKVKEVLDVFLELIHDELADERAFRYRGLGTFLTVRTRRRIGRNPRTGEMLKIPKKVRIRFRPGKRLKDAVAKATTKRKLQELAALMVSELLLYYSDEIDTGILEGILEQTMSAKLEDARMNYRARIPEGFEACEVYFEDAWSSMVTKRMRALSAMND